MPPPPNFLGGLTLNYLGMHSPAPSTKKTKAGGETRARLFRNKKLQVIHDEHNGDPDLQPHLQASSFHLRPGARFKVRCNTTVLRSFCVVFDEASSAMKW